MFAEFKKFIMRGNVLDMAVGIIIGIAFGAVVTSLVNDIIMPPIGMLMKNVNFNDLFVALNGGTYATLADAKKVSAPVIAYGSFINTLINFLIVSFAVFLLVKQVNRFQRPAPAAAPATKDCPFCEMAIPVGAKRCPHCTSSL